MLEWPPFTVVLLRVAIAALTLWIFLILSGRPMHMDKAMVVALLIMGLLNNAIPFSLILVGQKELGAGLAAVVNAMTPIWTLIIANSFTMDEKFSSNKLVGITFGFLGVAVLMGSDILTGLEASAWAQCAVLLATVSYGFAGVWGKRFKGKDPVLVSAGQLSASSLIMLPIAFFIEAPTAIDFKNIELLLSLLALAVICTAFAYILFFKILASAGALNVSLVTFLVPISAVLSGVIFLNESLSASELAGAGLILLGLLFVDGRVIRIRNR